MRRSARYGAALTGVLLAGCGMFAVAPSASALAVSDTPSPGIIDGDAVTVEEAAAVSAPLGGSVARPFRPHNTLIARGVEHNRHPERGVRR